MWATMMAVALAAETPCGVANEWVEPATGLRVVLPKGWSVTERPSPPTADNFMGIVLVAMPGAIGSSVTVQMYRTSELAPDALGAIGVLQKTMKLPPGSTMDAPRALPGLGFDAAGDRTVMGVATAERIAAVNGEWTAVIDFSVARASDQAVMDAARATVRHCR